MTDIENMLYGAGTLSGDLFNIIESERATGGVADWPTQGPRGGGANTTDTNKIIDASAHFGPRSGS
jgi:hypothetical protein